MPKHGGHTDLDRQSRAPARGAFAVRDRRHGIDRRRRRRSIPRAKPAAIVSAGCRERPIGLAGLSEPETVRHYTRLSRQNYAIDLGLFPLGRCTMKHNPRLNEKVARLPGFADVHPLQPVDTVQGGLQLIHGLGEWLIGLTGMHSVAMSPKAGRMGSCAGCSRSARRSKRAATSAR